MANYKYNYRLKWLQRYSTHNHLAWKWTHNHLDKVEFPEIQATVECGFTLKHVRDMIRTYSFTYALH